ncbi:MAG TPA: hypothetical protein VIN08_16900 [Ohtaekwangia sp.]|uniref:hypothetical protein n=1 Tax=Ohtaekwangia sp. TaxID=2066019 RepID=UPI002F920FDA
MKILIGSLLFICSISSEFRDQNTFDIENTIWKIEKIESDSMKYVFNVASDSCFKIKFLKLKKEKRGYRGMFSISSNVRDSNSPYFVQPPYQGFYFLTGTTENYIELGWISHRSYNPNFTRGNLGRVIYNAFWIGNGSFTFENNKLIISSGDGIVLTLVKA